MKRRVIFTEQQLKEILGEEVYNGVYMDSTSQGTEYSTDSIPTTDSEVIPTEPGGEPSMTDKYGKEKIPTNVWMRRGYHTLYENSKKKVLNEQNKEIDNQEVYLPKNVRKSVEGCDGHNEMMNNIASGEANLPQLYTWNNRLSKYGIKNGRLKRAIQHQIDVQKNKGESIRNTHSGLQQINNDTESHKGSKPTIYYDNNN